MLPGPKSHCSFSHALALQLTICVIIIIVVYVELAYQTYDGQYAVCLINANTLQERDLCSYAVAAVVLPLATVFIAFILPACCTCRFSTTPRASDVCGGVYGMMLACWWTAAAGVITWEIKPPLPPPFDAAQSSRVALTALLYIQIVLNLVLAVSGCSRGTCQCCHAKEVAAQALAQDATDRCERGYGADDNGDKEEGESAAGSSGVRKAAGFNTLNRDRQVLAGMIVLSEGPGGPGNAPSNYG